MSREELELMRELRRLSQCIPSFALEFASAELSVDNEIAFVHQLAGMAESLLRHANARRGLTIDGLPTPPVIDADFVQVADRRERPGRREPPSENDGHRP